MSYRELRNFCEIMRSVGYHRIISMENFRVPNFKLVAGIIYWLIKRFDPKADIPDFIDEDRDRVEFIKAGAGFFYTNLKIKLNLKKLYQADGFSVQELIKVAEVLYKAQKSVNAREDFDASNELDITSRLQDIKQIKSLSTEIVETGVTLLDLLEKEKSLKESREKALEFLDNLSRGSDSKKEHEQIEKSILSILESQTNNLSQLEGTLIDLKEKEKKLEEDIKHKSIELERADKRLESLNNVKPAHFSELRQLESELSQVYKIYVEKLRNHDYLEQQLETFHKLEEEHNKLRLEQLRSIQNGLKVIENNLMGDKNDLLEDDGDEYQQEALNKRNLREGVTTKNQQRDFAEDEGEGEDEEGEESENSQF